VRPPRDYRPRQLYAVTQRGNGGQWVYRDTQDFEKALELMGRYAKRHRVGIHGYCLLHNHAHWIFEASTPESISNLMRDMQGRYLFYLNRKYKRTPWLLIAPLYGCKDTDHFSPYLRMGPTNWTPRHDARFLDSKGFREFLRYIENNPVEAGLVRRPTDWPWTRATAHLADHDADDLLTLDQWRQIFGNPATVAHDWQVYLNGPREEAQHNSARTRLLHTGSRHNRPVNFGTGPPGV